MWAANLEPSYTQVQNSESHAHKATLYGIVLWCHYSRQPSLQVHHNQNWWASWSVFIKEDGGSSLPHHRRYVDGRSICFVDILHPNKGSRNNAIHWKSHKDDPSLDWRIYCSITDQQEKVCILQTLRKVTLFNLSNDAYKLSAGFHIAWDVPTSSPFHASRVYCHT